MTARKRICVICARGGSKGVPRKNVRLMCGVPLIMHTINHALQSALFDQVVVSSDDAEILAIAQTAGAYPLKRPDALATDTAGAAPAIEHALVQAEEKFNIIYDTLVVLQATSPLREVQDIVSAVDQFEREPQGTNLLSVTEASASPYYTLIENSGQGFALCKPSDAVRRQDLPEVYEINGAIYVWSRDYFLTHKKAINEKTTVYVMPKERSVDIDTATDFAVAEFLMSRRADG